MSGSGSEDKEAKIERIKAEIAALQRKADILYSPPTRKPKPKPEAKPEPEAKH